MIAWYNKSSFLVVFTLVSKIMSDANCKVMGLTPDLAPEVVGHLGTRCPSGSTSFSLNH